MHIWPFILLCILEHQIPEHVRLQHRQRYSDMNPWASVHIQYMRRGKCRESWAFLALHWNRPTLMQYAVGVKVILTTPQIRSQNAVQLPEWDHTAKRPDCSAAEKKKKNHASFWCGCGAIWAIQNFHVICTGMWCDSWCESHAIWQCESGLKVALRGESTGLTSVTSQREQSYQKYFNWNKNEFICIVFT